MEKYLEPYRTLQDQMSKYAEPYRALHEQLGRQLEPHQLIQEQLEKYLKPLSQYLSDPMMESVSINADGSLSIAGELVDVHEIKQSTIKGVGDKRESFAVVSISTSYGPTDLNARLPWRAAGAMLAYGEWVWRVS